MTDFRTLRPAAIVDADSPETTNTSRRIATVADPVLRIKVGQLNQSRLEVASRNTSSDAWQWWRNVWSSWKGGHHAARRRDTSWTLGFVPLPAWSVSTNWQSDGESCRCSLCSCRADAAEWPFLKYSWKIASVTSRKLREWAESRGWSWS